MQDLQSALCSMLCERNPKESKEKRTGRKGDDRWMQTETKGGSIEILKGGEDTRTRERHEGKEPKNTPEKDSTLKTRKIAYTNGNSGIGRPGFLPETLVERCDARSSFRT